MSSSIIARDVLASDAPLVDPVVSDGDASLTSDLLFHNYLVLSISILIICFFLTLFATLFPYLFIRNQQFTYAQILTLSIWHSFIAGVLLSASWVVFLPNMIDLSTHISLPTPSFPYILLFVSLLLPLLLDQFMLYMVKTKPSKLNDSETQNDISESPIGTPMRGGTPTGGSRRTSISGVAAPTAASGATAGALLADEEKKSMLGSLATRPPRSVRSGSRSNSVVAATYQDPESQPLTSSEMESGGSATPQQTPGSARSTAWYGSARLSVDAAEYKNRQSYLARCTMCKENITTNKGLAYHAAGCPLKSFHAFSFSSRWMQGLRGRRSAQRDIVLVEEGDAPMSDGLSPREKPYVGFTIACYVLVLWVYNIALAGGVDLQQAAYFISTATSSSSSEHAHHSAELSVEYARMALVSLVLLCFTWFYGFSLGLMLVLHRISIKNFRGWIAMIFYACSLPCAMLLNFLWASSVADKQERIKGNSGYELYLFVCQCMCCGILIYAAFVDMILEEWARKDGRVGKTIAFAAGATLVITIQIWAPL